MINRNFVCIALLGLISIFIFSKNSYAYTESLLDEAFQQLLVDIGIEPAISELAGVKRSCRKRCRRKKANKNPNLNVKSCVTKCRNRKDPDGDDVAKKTDNCPDVANPDQADSDGNGVGDACDVPDDDGDGTPNESDNCPSLSNPDQADSDSDGVGNACDNCVSNANPGQEDMDSDNVGDACEVIDLVVSDYYDDHLFIFKDILNQPATRFQADVQIDTVTSDCRGLAIANNILYAGCNDTVDVYSNFTGLTDASTPSKSFGPTTGGACDFSDYIHGLKYTR